MSERRQPAAPIPSSLLLEEATRLGLIKILGNIKVNERGCWVWQGYCHTQWGYGECSWRSENWPVHRLTWTLMKGPIPEGKILCHRCDNPPCCNPDHLWPGTDKENHLDKTAKGRHHYDKNTKTRCKQGHEFTVENTRVVPVPGRPGLYKRQCKTCTAIGHKRPEYIAWRREYQRKRRAALREKRLALRAQREQTDLPA